MASEIKKSLEEKRSGQIAGCSLDNNLIFLASMNIHGDLHILCSQFVTPVETTLCNVFFHHLTINTVANKSNEGATVNE